MPKNSRIRPLPDLLPLLLALALSTAGADAGDPHPSLPLPVIPDCLGVNIHFTDPKPGELEMLAAAGFKWVRMDFSWEGTERKKGEYDFSAYDRLAAALEKHGLRAVFILNYGNPLYDGGLPPTSKNARAAFAHWAVEGVRHFAGKGHIWEMWNEPNGGFWKPKADVKQYAALARATGEALRDAKLLGPKGEAFIGPATSTIDLPFLEACFQAGLLEFWDAVSVHPYRQQAPENVDEEYRGLRLLIRKYAPKDKVIPIVSGEWGYSDAWQHFTPELQGKYLPREFLTNIANDVTLSIWYDWHDDGTNPKESEHHFGIVANEYHPGRDPVYDPKPAYHAMKTLAAQLDGFRFNKALDLGLGVHPLLFSKEEAVRIAYWVDSRDRVEKPPDGKTGGGASIMIPASPGEFFVTGKAEEIVKDIYNDPAFPASTRVWGNSEWISGRPILVKDGASPALFLGASETPVYFSPAQPNPILQIAAAWKRLPLELILDPKRPRSYTDVARNPLDHAINIVLKGVSRTLQPHEECAAEHVLEPSRGESVTAEYTLGLPNRDVFSQSTRYVSSSPIHFTVFPTSGATLNVRIENPMGEPFVGKLRLVPFPSASLGGANPIEPAFDAVSVQLSQGELEKVVPLPLREAAPAHYAARLSLDEAGKDGVAVAGVVQRRVSLDEGDSAHPIVYGLYADGDAKVASHQTLAAETPRDQPPYVDGNSFKIAYDFAPGWKFLELTRSEIPWPEIAGVPEKLGWWIHGDAGGCQPRVRFKDKTGQVFQPSGPKIDWKGWRYVTFPMRVTEDGQLSHWGGANDGAIHYPIRWDSLFLLDNVSRQAAKGEIFISAPTLIY
jgi:polysaccharide biosynthesis protein PslG